MNTSNKVLNLISKFPILIYLFIFLLLSPIALDIKFQHNDDWVYYFSVQNFLNGNFTLHPYIAATTYSQTWAGYLFSLLFGISNLPVLTLLVSVLSVYVLFLILNHRIGINLIDSILISMFLLVNGIFVFTSIGFMTDNYFILFFLLALYFLYDSKLYQIENGKNIPKKYYLQFGLGILFVFLAYFTRQLGMLIPLALFIWLLTQKKYFFCLLNLSIFLIIYFYHSFVFSKSVEALETNFIFSNLTYFRYLYSLVSVILFYIAFFLMPLVFPDIKNINLYQKKWLKYVLFVILLTVLNFNYFKSIWWVGSIDFGFKYIFQTKGFFVENIHGLKSELSLNPFFVVRTFGRMVVAVVLSYILFFRKIRDFNNPFAVLSILYIGSLFIIEKIYDRYLLPIFPLFILAGTSIYLQKFNLSNLRRYFVVGYLVFLGFISYNFSADYILTNSYIWEKSNYLVNSFKVSPNSITATDTWGYLYKRKDEIYKFTYDNPSIQNYGERFELIDTYRIEYPFQLLNNTIYLYMHRL